MATLDDIARALGVSKSTVSKALSGARDVSAAMRQTVLEKAVELGYSKGPRNTNAPRLALFITNMAYTEPEDFGYDLIAGFRKAAEPAGFQVELIPLSIEMQQQTGYDAYMIQHNYRGSLFLGLSLRQDPWMKDFETCKTPAILYDNHISSNPRVTHVGVDNAEGMVLAVQHLKELGHSKIGYLSSELEAYVYRQRYHAFFQALKTCGLEADESLAGCSYFINDCMQHLPALLKQGCTAIVCSHDLLAHSAMIHCAQMGLRVPEDISILGFDDIPMCRYTLPPLSSIRQDRINIGKSAFYAMLNQLNNVHVTSLLLHPELVERSSCAKVSEQK